MVENVLAAPKHASSLAASLRRRASRQTTSHRKTRVGVFLRHSSGRTPLLRSQVAQIASGCTAQSYETVSGRPQWLSRDPSGENGGINLYSYVSNDPTNAIDPLGLWQITLFGGEGLGGYLSFGNNGGTGVGIKSLFNGQWNISVRGGGGAGFAASLDTSDSGRQCPGWSGNFPTFAGSVGEGVLGVGFEAGVNHGNVGDGSTNPYLSVGGRFGPFNKTWTGGIGINSPTTGFYGSFGHGFTNYGAAAFVGGGVTWTSN